MEHSQHTFRSDVSTPSTDATVRPIPVDRLVFPPAYEALRPFFDHRTQWGRSGQEVLAYRTLKDHFPELSPQEVFLTVITARRLFSANLDEV